MRDVTAWWNSLGHILYLESQQPWRSISSYWLLLADRIVDSTIPRLRHRLWHILQRRSHETSRHVVCVSSKITINSCHQITYLGVLLRIFEVLINSLHVFGDVSVADLHHTHPPSVHVLTALRVLLKAFGLGNVGNSASTVYPMRYFLWFAVSWVSDIARCMPKDVTYSRTLTTVAGLWYVSKTYDG